MELGDAYKLLDEQGTFSLTNAGKGSRRKAKISVVQIPKDTAEGLQSHLGGEVVQAGGHGEEIRWAWRAKQAQAREIAERALPWLEVRKAEAHRLLGSL